MICTIAGPKSCGKSVLAEKQVINNKTTVSYIGTLPNEERYLRRIMLHRLRRPHSWKIIEVNGSLIDVYPHAIASPPHTILFDGLAIYTGRIITSAVASGIMISEMVNYLKKEIKTCIEYSKTKKNDIWIVTNTSLEGIEVSDVKNAVLELNDVTYTLSDSVQFLN